MDREVDFELVRQLRSRDRDEVAAAFDTLYRKYRSQVYNTSYRILGDRGHAADATQETFVTILRKARKFNFRSAFSSWLYRVAVNRCLDIRRRVERRRPLSMSAPEVSSWAEQEDRRKNPLPGPQDSAGKAELDAAVAAAVARLNPRLSAVVVLRYMEGLGYEEIAEVMRVPLGTVKSRLNRAHAALEEELGPLLARLL